MVVTPAGAEIRFATAGERVTVVIPTRDRPELLSACLESLFARTAYPAFDVVVIDNDSRLPETHELLANWLEREPGALSRAGRSRPVQLLARSTTAPSRPSTRPTWCCSTTTPR